MYMVLCVDTSAFMRVGYVHLIHLNLDVECVFIYKYILLICFCVCLDICTMIYPNSIPCVASPVGEPPTLCNISDKVVYIEAIYYIKLIFTSCINHGYIYIWLCCLGHVGFTPRGHCPSQKDQSNRKEFNCVDVLRCAGGCAVSVGHCAGDSSFQEAFWDTWLTWNLKNFGDVYTLGLWPQKTGEKWAQSWSHTLVGNGKVAPKPVEANCMFGKVIEQPKLFNILFWNYDMICR